MSSAACASKAPTSQAAKRAKTGDDNTGEEEDTSPCILGDDIPTSGGEGITSKVNSLTQKVAQKATMVTETQEKAADHRSKGDDANELATLRELTALQGKNLSLQSDLQTLRDEFRNGSYFSATSDYFRMESVNIGGHATYSKIKWQNFCRSTDVADTIEARNFASGRYEVTTPYKSTREGAEDDNKHAPPSGTARTSASQQKKKETRDKVWPTDVFGNPADKQHISHLLPAGRHDHKEWFPVAVAVVGLEMAESIDADARLGLLKKVTRGFLDPTAKTPSKEGGTGVVHFVTNKLRMMYQKEVWDAENCNALMIPIMKLEDAVAWVGQSYRALFIIGKPDDGATDPVTRFDQVKVDYRNVNLNTDVIIRRDTVKDASKEQIERARETLIEATLAIRDMIADLPDDEIEKFGLPKNGESLKDAKAFAESSECILPGKVDSSPTRRPVCVIEFASNSGDNDRHPSPDPLLLAYKAAVVWAKMTGKRLLANGAPPDPYPDMTEEDFIAEQAYCEAKYPSHQTPKTWQELAVGLGQPFGYEE